MPRRRKLPPSPPRLVLHGFDPVRWAKRWGIEPVEHPCYHCGIEKRSSLPFVQGTMRGLESPPCVCGDGSRAPYAMVHATGLPIDQWGDLTGRT